MPSESSTRPTVTNGVPLSGTATPLASTIVTMQLGLALTLLLGLMFLSGGMFYLYTFNYDIGPYFTITRVIHFYAGFASIPFLVAKYGSTTLRAAGYYLRIPRFYKAGPPSPMNRVLSPLLVLNFFVLYFSGLYMIFHYYYTVTNIPPFEFKPVQVHMWAAVIAVPLIGVHLGTHFLEAIRGLAEERQTLAVRERAAPGSTRAAFTRKAFLGTVIAGGLGLAFAFQNTRLGRTNFHGLFIGRVPEAERGGPGGFPSETLFGMAEIDLAAWRLQLEDADGVVRELDYQQLLALAPVSERIRVSCVSGWTARAVWSGPRVRDVLSLVDPLGEARSIEFHSASNYSWVWHAGRLRGDDALLATHLGGMPLSLDHGFPVRLMVPGYPGQNMVKQLDRISVRRADERQDPDFKLARAGDTSGCGASV